VHSMAVRLLFVNAQRLISNQEDVVESQPNEKGLSIYISHSFKSEGSAGRDCVVGGQKRGSDLRRVPSGRD
jgi:hypothetical protein